MNIHTIGLLSRSASTALIIKQATATETIRSPGVTGRTTHGINRNEALNESPGVVKRLSWFNPRRWAPGDSGEGFKGIISGMDDKFSEGLSGADKKLFMQSTSAIRDNLLNNPNVKAFDESAYQNFAPYLAIARARIEGRSAVNADIKNPENLYSRIPGISVDENKLQSGVKFDQREIANSLIRNNLGFANILRQGINTDPRLLYATRNSGSVIAENMQPAPTQDNINNFKRELTQDATDKYTKATRPAAVKGTMNSWKNSIAQYLAKLWNWMKSLFAARQQAPA